MTTSPVTEFLAARWGEEQQLAEAAAKDASPRYDVDGTHWRSSDGEYISCEEATLAVGPYGFIGDAFASHVVAHDPARVLADIAAKRAIVEDYQIVMANNAIERANDGDELKIAARELVAKSLRMVLIRLAAPYADHPDFDETWRPADV